MDIVYLFQDPYPWDVRVEKFAGSLVEAGHRVHVVARNRKGERTYEALADNFDVYRLPGGFGRWGHYVLNFPAFFSPFWIGRLVQVVNKTDAGLIIVRDLPLAATGLIVSHMTGLPVLLDMAENYPAMIESTWRFRGARPQDYLLRNPRLLTRLERLVVPRMAGVLVVSEASHRRVQALKSVMPPIWVVGNTPRLDQPTTYVEHPLSVFIQGHPGLTLLYVGYLEHVRGLDVAVRSLPTLVARGIDPLLVVVGEGENRPGLERLASSLGIASHVHFAGWIDQRYLQTIIASADVCLVPHYVTEHTETTLPNKIFDYMAQAKPVVVTHAAALRDIVEKYGCGLSYTDTNPDELAQQLLSLSDAALRRKMGESGLRAVQQTFNWDVDSHMLLKAVKQVVCTDQLAERRSLHGDH